MNCSCLAMKCFLQVKMRRSAPWNQAPAVMSMLILLMVLFAGTLAWPRSVAASPEQYRTGRAP